MVKNLFLLFLFVVNALAISSFELANNIINNKDQVQKLRLLFDNNKLLDNNGKLDISSIAKILKSNSLLELTLANPVVLRFNFKAKAEAVLFFKIINDALNYCGYVYFLPINLILRDKNIDYTIEVNSRYILDPESFYKILKSNGVYIENIKKTGKYEYEYDLNFDKAKLKPNANIPLNIQKTFEKPLKDYIILSKNANSITIDAHNLDSWFPKVLFLDKNLNLIKSIQTKEKNNHISEIIPDGNVYIIISDMFNLDNIKRGLKIYLKK